MMSSAPAACNGSFTAPPAAFMQCPITLEVMVDPAVAADGFTYERTAIAAWLAAGKDTSPQTGAALAHPHLAPNIALRQAIAEWRAAQTLQLAPGRVVLGAALGRGAHGVVYGGTLDGATPVAVRVYDCRADDSQAARARFDAELRALVVGCVGWWV